MQISKYRKAEVLFRFYSSYRHINHIKLQKEADIEIFKSIREKEIIHKAKQFTWYQISTQKPDGLKCVK